MQERSGMFSCENVNNILTFVEGYGSALTEHNIKDSDLEDFSNFNEFVKKHYDVKSTHANWAMMIRYNSSSGKESFDNFFKILNTYHS